MIPKVSVSTSKGSYNITKNHTDVTLVLPGSINFTVAVVAIDPYFFCKHLHFSWNFGDGCNASGKHVEHHYNNTGVYGVVLKIYKVFKDDGGERKLMGNVTMNIHVVKGLLQSSSSFNNVSMSTLVCSQPLKSSRAMLC